MRKKCELPPPVHHHHPPHSHPHREPCVTYLGDLHRVQIDRGDVVVLEVGEALSTQEKEYLTKELRNAFPNNRALVLSKNCKLGIVSSRER